MKIIFIFLTLLFITACSAPSHVVMDNNDMTIYTCITNNDSSSDKYTYYITDEVGGWTFITDKKFKLGDKVSIYKKE